LRHLAPAEGRRHCAAKRGEDVLFAGIRPRANLLIRSLEMHGSAQILGPPVEFHGLVSNLTMAPAIHDEPIQIRLSGKDSSQFEFRATIDRTHGRLRDEMFVHCQAMKLNDQLLGHANVLQLKVAPSIASLTVSMCVEGDRLSGEIQLVQKDVRMTPSFAGEGDTLPIGEALDQSLGQLDSLATRLSLEGTIDEPACKLWSNLGPAVAEALEQEFQRHAEAHARAVLADAQRHVDERLAELERQTAEQQEQFAKLTAKLPQRIDAMARAQTRRERMSVEQVGRRLPTTSILR
jgi:uncharacterized protein (TIGR03545 family)